MRGVCTFISDDFNREDIAAAWLQYVVHDLIQLINAICLGEGIKRVFFCGGFVCHPLIRHKITKEFARTNMFFSEMRQVDTDSNFVVSA
jgi:hydrogenase maturation factor HypF (carbamoyltransferase family)